MLISPNIRWLGIPCDLLEPLLSKDKISGVAVHSRGIQEALFDQRIQDTSNIQRILFLHRGDDGEFKKYYESAEENSLKHYGTFPTGSLPENGGIAAVLPTQRKGKGSVTSPQSWCGVTLGRFDWKHREWLCSSHCTIGCTAFFVATGTPCFLFQLRHKNIPLCTHFEKNPEMLHRH